MAWKFELIAGPTGNTSEGPTWDGRYVYYTLNRLHKIMRYDPKSKEMIDWATDTRHGNGTYVDGKGVLYACCSGDRSIVRYDANGRATTVVDRLDGKRLNTPNDIVADRFGRLWFSNPWNDVFQPHGTTAEMDDESVCCAEQGPDGKWTARRATFNTTRPNGVAVSPDHKTLYVSECDMRESGLRELRAYPILDNGLLGRHIVMHQFGWDYRGVQRPVDGMRVDVEGNIVAACGYHKSGPGPLMYVFSPTGRVIETHPIPDGAIPTNCTFAEDDMKTLYVTTTQGHLFRARTDMTGFRLTA